MRIISQHWNNYNSSERMRIDSSGNVGIGTTSPDSKLHVVDSNSNGLRIGYTGNTNYYDAPIHIWRHPSGFAERMRIDSAGRLLVGTSSARTNYSNTSPTWPAFKLEGTSNSNRVLSFFTMTAVAPLLVLGSTGGSTAGRMI